MVAEQVVHYGAWSEVRVNHKVFLATLDHEKLVEEIEHSLASGMSAREALHLIRLRMVKKVVSRRG